MAQAQQEQDTQHQSDLDALHKKHDAEMKALQMRFNEELAAERAKLEEEKEADLARLQEALSGSLSEQQELQLQMLKEQHDRELEAVREELVRTHMEKFTEMTARLETEHEVCSIGNVQYINIPTWLRGFQVKLVKFLSFFCPSFPKRYFDLKQTLPDI